MSSPGDCPSSTMIRRRVWKLFAGKSSQLFLMKMAAATAVVVELLFGRAFSCCITPTTVQIMVQRSRYTR